MNRLPRVALTTLLSCLWLLATQGPSQARTWDITVDGLGDAPTIQAGVDSAAVGDTILVGPGTYLESVYFGGKDLVLKSQIGPDVTTVDATGIGNAVARFEVNESRNAVLDGFTLTGGINGVAIFEAQPTIRGNVITGNSGAFGAGIFCTGNGHPGPWSPLIVGNTITGNTCRSVGGGIGVWTKMTPEIIDNVIVGNQATEGDGGGIYYRGSHGGGVIRGNWIEGNSVNDHGGGISVWSNRIDALVDVEIAWNIIVDNVAAGAENTGDSGGGIHTTRASAWIHHNTIVGNTGEGWNPAHGGGISVEDGNPIIEQNIIALSGAGGGIACLGTAAPTIRNNLAWENMDGEGGGTCAAWWESNGNVVVDPLLCDPANGVYFLPQTSPALTHPEGPLGAYPDPGCTQVPVARTTWGLLKQLYRSSGQ